jgi:DNA-binding NarL/FixJ family response regulator
MTILFLGLYLSARREFSLLAAQFEKLQKQTAQQRELQEALLANLAAEVQQLRDAPRVQPAATISMNLTRRHQVLRLARQGESAEAIAASLRTPLREVELVLKVHRGIPPVD